MGSGAVVKFNVLTAGVDLFRPYSAMRLIGSSGNGGAASTKNGFNALHSKHIFGTTASHKGQTVTALGLLLNLTMLLNLVCFLAVQACTATS